MAKIYVSSTYQDLVDYRKAVYDALHRLRHEVTAMEDYVASDKRPLDQCLMDVAESDIYVGIFAWRYGYVPTEDNPHAQSITELEYRKAVESNKHPLVFLVDEDAAWPRQFMD